MNQETTAARHMPLKFLMIWYHTRMMNYYSRLSESVFEDPESGMTEEAEEHYLDYWRKMRLHRCRVRELEGA